VGNLKVGKPMCCHLLYRYTVYIADDIILKLHYPGNNGRLVFKWDSAWDC